MGLAMSSSLESDAVINIGGLIGQLSNAATSAAPLVITLKDCDVTGSVSVSSTMTGSEKDCYVGGLLGYGMKDADATFVLDNCTTVTPDVSVDSSVISVGDDWGKNEWAMVSNTTQDTYYSTIQAAIDAAGEGDTIQVSGGTYDEDVTVNKEGLTIQSKVLHEAEIQGTAVIQADNATLDGFKITNFSQIPTPDKSGVYVPSGTGIRIANNLIDGDGIDPVANLTVGIHTLYNGNAEATLENNLIQNVRMGVYNQGAEMIISNNTIENAAHCGIGVDTALGTTIAGNTISDCSVGLELYRGNVSVTGNQFSGNETAGIWMTGNIAEVHIGSEGSEEDANTITGSTTRDIHVKDATGPAHIWAENVYDSILLVRAK
jgi:parallel beta-helix repeat protein